MPASQPFRRTLGFFWIAAALAGCDTSGAAPPPPVDDSPGAAAADAPYAPSGAETVGTAVAILIDNSGSMAARESSGKRRKHVVAREAIRAALAVTQEHVRDNPGYPIKIGIYRFASDVERVRPIVDYDSAGIAAALRSFPPPDGSTAIGDAMEAARRDLYEAGLIRKYILVVTDGENTTGRSPEEVVKEIARRSDGGVGIYYIAFDVSPDAFRFVRDAGGDVFPARGGAQLRSALAEVYRGRILAESEDYGDAFPQPAGEAVTENATRSGQP